MVEGLVAKRVTVCVGKIKHHVFYSLNIIRCTYGLRQLEGKPFNCEFFSTDIYRVEGSPSILNTLNSQDKNSFYALSSYSLILKCAPYLSHGVESSDAKLIDKPGPIVLDKLNFFK